MPGNETTLVIPGKVTSPGLAEGNTFVHRDRLRFLDAPVSIETKNVEREVDHLEDATAMISGDLLALATRVEKEMDSRLAAVFETHQLMLNDPALKEELRCEIRGNLVSASSAVKAVFLRWEKRFLLMESRMARQKGEDMRDISNRLSNALAGIKIHPLEQIPPGSVLVASRLLPSDTVFLSRQLAAAVLLEYGGAGSHAALFAREMGLPCLAKVRECLALMGSQLGISSLPRLGAMIETPAAALSVRALEPYADFISFGTNDLTQYAFAADRENAAVEQYFQDSSPVIFRLLQIAHDDAPDMPLAVCGELAGRAAHVRKLLQCGVRTFSVAPPLIPSIKEAIRQARIA